MNDNHHQVKQNILRSIVCCLTIYRLQFKALLVYHDDHDYYNES